MYCNSKGEACIAYSLLRILLYKVGILLSKLYISFIKYTTIY